MSSKGPLGLAEQVSLPLSSYEALKKGLADNHMLDPDQVRQLHAHLLGLPVGGEAELAPTLVEVQPSTTTVTSWKVHNEVHAAVLHSFIEHPNRKQAQ